MRKGRTKKKTSVSLEIGLLKKLEEIARQQERSVSYIIEDFAKKIVDGSLSAATPQNSPQKSSRVAASGGGSSVVRVEDLEEAAEAAPRRKQARS